MCDLNYIAMANKILYWCRYDDATILAGQGTVGMEVHEQMKDMHEPLDAIVVPVGGGGLMAGVSVAMKHLSPNTEVIVSAVVCKMDRMYILCTLCICRKKFSAAFNIATYLK